MSWQKVKIEIPKDYSPTERVAIAEDIIEFIQKRTASGKDIEGNPFPKYSKAYKESLNFKIAGKSSRVNLKLSGDLMSAIELLSHKSGELLIGYENGTPENDKAEGNQLGSYGQPDPNPAKARPFLGITKDDLKTILEDYPLTKKEERERLAEVREAARELTEKFKKQTGIKTPVYETEEI